MTFGARHIVLGTAVLLQNWWPAAASRYQEIERTLKCQSFHAIARTVILMPSGLFSSARSQAIWIIDEKTGISRPVNLYQHRSYDRLNHEHAALDALAWQWRCFHARSGLDYLFVDFGCHNDSARTCSTAMGLSGGEWSAIYDSYGRTVLYAKDGWTQADERRLRALGLLTEWYSPYPTGPTYDIYF